MSPRLAAARRPQRYRTATARSHGTIQQRSADLEDFCRRRGQQSKACRALLAELRTNSTNAGLQDALAGGRGEPLRGRRDVNRWLLDTLQPASCDSARIMVLPAWHAGVGSSLLMFARLAMLGIEHGYTIVPLGWREDQGGPFQLWKFATGLDPPTHEFFLEPLSSCGVEARRRRANTTVWSQYDRVNIFELLRRGVHTVRIAQLQNRRWGLAGQLVDIIDGAGFNRTARFAERRGLRLADIQAHLLGLVLQPRPWLAVRLREWGRNTDAAMHVRAGDFVLDGRCRGSDCRGHTQLSDYLEVVKASGARHVFVASDVPSTTSRLRLLATDVYFFNRSSFVVGGRLAAESVVTRLPPKDVMALTTDVLVDMHVLEVAPLLVGSQSSWWPILCALRTLRGAANLVSAGRPLIAPAILVSRSRDNNARYRDCEGNTILRPLRSPSA